mmetsp:Transcript_3796/g.11284  ORF Transcript_3796/g.11284 Transcript_3796/m.11284 type:complete len:212 (+) Transcript_3796:226-861(+)|eukprot:CAMPEP_0198722766 /NCGR_PEP_ID=MMETSP1475-20131203/364_1 /TAXON_ID= ORGANISM="Unidentified sp., Strain CCMP1999" /NCGR_SAMPLE_ID=MMETSP1475 /ASSEMBLY_ACC=CAM_ASM_001111 /LENGTH=211 /DNA_ID=CAMNT_0044483687 /DNA_START=141 /DNA_END=776 /DNA_ORIENTATION=+
MAFVSTVAVSRNSRFCGARVTQRSAAVTGTVRMSASKAVPFLESPPKLDPKAPGYADFDPLGFSSAFNLKFLREAELKHGRICMLAALGWVFPEFYHLPAPEFSNTSPLSALGTVPKLGLLQIVLAIAALEAIGFDRVYYSDNWEPGDYGFDPLNLGKGKALDYYKTAEVKNGRLAMIAIGGFIHQNLLTNMGIVEQMRKGYFTPDRFPLN